MIFMKIKRYNPGDRVICIRGTPPNFTMPIAVGEIAIVVKDTNGSLIRVKKIDGDFERLYDRTRFKFLPILNNNTSTI